MKSELESLRVQILPDHYRLSTKSKKSTKSSIMLSIASIAITLWFLFALYSYYGRSSFRYSVVIDAGSSGSRVHVFRYWLKSGEPVFDFGEENYANLKVNPGLSAYADNPEGASVSVSKLVEFAKGRVPKEMLKESDIRLMATAGMRLLDVTVQEQILEVTRSVFRSSGFKFEDDWASVITGSDEGVYAWIVANSALDSLGGDPLETTGIVELGGASAQVTFVSREVVPPEYSRTVTYDNVDYKLYSHSFLHYGQDEAQKELLKKIQNLVANSTKDTGVITDPCYPKGYNILDKNSSGIVLQASGNYSQCRSATYALLQEGKEKCHYKHCSIGSTYTPDLQGSFLATANFYYTSKFFGLEEKDWLSEMIVAGKSFCGEEWSKLKEKYPKTKEQYLHGYCFSPAYIISMLHDSLGFALDDERIKFASKAGEANIPLDWALGAFILNTETATSELGYTAKSRKILGFSNVAKIRISD